MGLGYSSEWRIGVGSERDVIISDDRHVLGNTQVCLANSSDCPDRHQIVASKHTCGSLKQRKHLLHRLVPTWRLEVSPLNKSLVIMQSIGCQSFPVTLDTLPARRHIGRACNAGDL